MIIKNEAEGEGNFRIYFGEEKEWMATADAYNFILSKKCTPKEGDGRKKTYYRVEGYYNHFRDLLESLSEKKLRESEIKSVAMLKKELHLIRNDLAHYAEAIRL